MYFFFFNCNKFFRHRKVNFLNIPACNTKHISEISPHYCLMHYCSVGGKINGLAITELITADATLSAMLMNFLA